MSERKRKRTNETLAKGGSKKQKVPINDSNDSLITGLVLNPLYLTDVVQEVFKWLDGFYLTTILVQKSWRDLSIRSIRDYLEVEFGINCKSIDAAWNIYTNILRSNGLPEVSVLYRISQNKAILEKISTENIPEKAEILHKIVESSDLAEPHFNNHLLKNWREIYEDLKKYEFNNLNTKTYKAFLRPAKDLTKDSDAIERLIKRLKVHQLEKLSYEHLGDKSFRNGALKFTAVDQQAKTIKLCWNYAMYTNLSHDDARGFHNVTLIDSNDESLIACLAPPRGEPPKNTILVPSFESSESSKFHVMLHKKDAKALLERLGEPELDPVKLYCLIMMFANMDFVLKKERIPHPIISTDETDLGNYCHSIRMLSYKYDHLTILYEIIDAKKRDPSTWSNFFNYDGDKRDEYFNQIKLLALQINFLYMQLHVITFSIDSCAPAFGHYKSARIAIGHEGEPLKDKLVINYLHEIYLNSAIDGGLYGGAVAEKEGQTTCYVSIKPADEIIFPPASKFPNFSAEEAIPSTNKIFMPEDVQQLIPKEFDLIGFDTLSDILIIMLGFSEYSHGSKTKQCETHYCGGDFEAKLPCHKYRHWCPKKHNSVTFNAKRYNIDIDKLAKNYGLPAQQLTEQDHDLEY